MRQEEFTIIGGGVAGLCAAIRLTELGAVPLIVEAGSYPAHKICGEFLSSECLPQLQKWGINPVLIHQAHIHMPNRPAFEFKFPHPAGALSHLTLDPQLAQYAQARGAKILTKTKIHELHPYNLLEGFHHLELSNGEKVKTKHLILATGRLLQYGKVKPKMKYVGLKAHFQDIPLQDTLEMFAVPGAYIGIAPIEGNRFNVACLTTMSRFTKASSPEAFITDLTHEHPLLHAYLSRGKNLFPQWMHSPVPSFGIKRVPDWPHTYFIGDAIATIPPATGNGLSMAILGGCLAAEYAMKDDFAGFKQAWHQRYDKQIRWGKLLHQTFLHPGWTSPCLTWLSRFPNLAAYIFERTRFMKGM